ncbi:GAF and ANTAR domain-containing protein [Microbacteriaceae bacterium VKM Ac-2855]|nr:GAF and ANTAR domain-containing protein [Microbacteriaceae bacterium VKM Ac-2855]
MPARASGSAVLCAPYLRGFPVSGAAVSSVAGFFPGETIEASDPTAARLDEIQLDLGEGPCWDAVRVRRPILIPDPFRTAPARWPMFSAALDHDRIRSLFAFPLRLGTLDVGCVDLYSTEPVELEPRQVEKISSLAVTTAIGVLGRLLTDDDDSDALAQPYSRRVVHQATGMVLASLRITPEDALLIIRGHAFAQNRTVLDVADDIVARRIDFATLDLPARNDEI